MTVLQEGFDLLLFVPSSNEFTSLEPWDVDRMIIKIKLMGSRDS